MFCTSFLHEHWRNCTWRSVNLKYCECLVTTGTFTSMYRSLYSFIVCILQQTENNWFTITKAPSTRIQILLNPYTFLSRYAFRPHASGESDLRIWKLLNPHSRVETFESDLFSDTCGRSNPDTFESDDVARSGPVSTVVSTAWLQNNTAANQNVFAVLVGLRALGKTPNLYFRLSLKLYILYTLLVGVRPRHRSK